MRRQTRTVLLSSLAATGLAALGFGVWLTATPMPTQAEDLMPTPPEPPRLADGPEVERCLALLRSDPDEARTFAESWDAREPNDGAKHCHALALLALGEPVLAAQRLEHLAGRSRAGNPARAAVFAQAAQAWLMAGSPNRAFAASTLALTLTPDDVDMLIDRAVTLGAMSRYEEAIPDLDHALAIDPNRAEALVYRAAARRHLDRVREASLDVERALTLQPNHAEALLERGILRQLGGDTAGARADWERAIELAPDSPTADLAAQNLALNEAGPQRR